MRAVASPPARSPAQYSPALVWGTTRFGMGRGVSTPLSTTRTPDGKRHLLDTGFEARIALLCPLTCERAKTGTGLGHEDGSAPVGYPLSTCRLATGSSPRGLTPLVGWDGSSWGGLPA